MSVVNEEVKDGPDGYLVCECYEAGSESIDTIIDENHTRKWNARIYKNKTVFRVHGQNLSSIKKG